MLCHRRFTIEENGFESRVRSALGDLLAGCCGEGSAAFGMLEGDLDHSKML
jgi:hypothetical protein